MATQTSGQNFTRSETSERANKIYREKIRPLMTEDDIGKYVVVDVNSGEYEIDERAVKANRRLEDRAPDSRRFTLRVGFSAAYFFGWHEEPKL